MYEWEKRLEEDLQKFDERAQQEAEEEKRKEVLNNMRGIELGLDMIFFSLLL